MATKNRRYFATRREAEEAIKEHHPSFTGMKVYHIKKGHGRRNGLPFWIGTYIEWLNRY